MSDSQCFNLARAAQPELWLTCGIGKRWRKLERFLQSAVVEFSDDEANRHELEGRDSPCLFGPRFHPLDDFCKGRALTRSRQSARSLNGGIVAL